MYERGKSDRSVVPANPSNKATAAEVGEERERAKGNTDSKTHPGPSAGTDTSSALSRVREVARRDKDVRFTALPRRVNWVLDADIQNFSAELIIPGCEGLSSTESRTSGSASASPCDAPLPERALRSQNLRQEPDAVVPHVGICAGGRP
jgi:hypothetical protein